ncbi:MAG: hypothetical protein ACREA0_30225 [bacterium]
MATAHVENGIARIVDSARAGLIGVSSLAAGADQMFAGKVLQAGGTLHLIIPSRGYEATFDNRRDLDNFLSLSRRASRIEMLEYPEPSEEAFLAAGRRVVDTCDVLVAVWDGQPAKGLGGTADIVQYARRQGISVEVVWPVGVAR